MSVMTSTIQVSGLASAKLRALREQARAAGMTAEAYAKQLIEAGVLLEQEARSKTFDELYAPVQAEFRKSGLTEDQLGELVDIARTRTIPRASKKKA